MMTSAMEEELGHDACLLWEEDESWAFLELPGDENPADQAKDEEAPPPPPPPAAKGKKRSAAEEGGSGGGGESDDHELHIWTERERRKKMRNMFANLHALLPHIPPKADKSTVVDEAVKHIKKLQQKLEELQKAKLERLQGGIIPCNPNIAQRTLAVQSREAFLAEQGPTAANTAAALASPNPLFSGPEYPAIFRSWTSPNVILNVCGRDAHISVCSARKPGLLSAVCFVLEKHCLDVVSAQISSDLWRCMYMIHARGNGGAEQLQQAFPIEEIYKQAAAEIMLWVNS